MPETQGPAYDCCIEVVSGMTVEVISSAICASQGGFVLMEGVR
jgi:hypothetical protein